MKANVTSLGERPGSHTFESLQLFLDSVPTVPTSHREDVAEVEIELVMV